METLKNDVLKNQDNDQGSKKLLDTLTPTGPNIPADLQDYRDTWEKRVELIDDETKEKIIQVAKKIPVEVEYESDGSKLIILKLWKKTIKLFSPRLENYTDEKYRDKRMFDYEFSSAFDFNGKIYRDTVKLWWMIWDDILKWENQKLKWYIMQKKEDWYYIASIEDVKKILSDLWKIAGLEHKAKDKEQIIFEEMALLTYLTGISGDYRLTMWDNQTSWSDKSRSIAHFSMWYCDFDSMDSNNFDGNIFMLTK